MSNWSNVLWEMTIGTAAVYSAPGFANRQNLREYVREYVRECLYSPKCAAFREYIRMWGFREDTREDNNRQNQNREFSVHFVLLANFASILASIFASTVQSTQYTVQRTAYSAVQCSTVHSSTVLYGRFAKAKGCGWARVGGYDRDSSVMMMII